jgi:signal transduction histidine kinase
MLSEAANRGVTIKILVPYDERIQEIVNSSTEENNNTNNHNSMRDRINVRFLEPQLHTRISILIVDRQFSLTAELKDDTKNASLHAIGLSSYSNSKSTVLSYVSIFETLWKQAEMYEQLKSHDMMQKEFINIAAHELRTPIQPIIGLSDFIRDKKGDIQQYVGLIDVILRNAKRLKRLTEDILDVSRIENRSLQLNKERFSLRDMIEHMTAEYAGGKNRALLDTNVRFNIEASNNDNILVDADKERIARVLDNLLINATKFTKEGSITIKITMGRKGSSDKREAAVTNTVVSITDTGEGIDPRIYPRLFTKFATASHIGTGLGLFISKNIIEAHGGKIWAQNNLKGKGATFSFSLPSITI